MVYCVHVLVIALALTTVSYWRNNTADCSCKGDRSTSSISSTVPPEETLKRVCYYTPFHHLEPNLTALNLTLCTHVIYGYSVVENNSTLVPKMSYLDPDRYVSFTKHVKCRYREVKTLLSVSEGSFSEMVINETNRKRFVASAVEQIIKWGFDGLDVDWEFPTFHERCNFVKFLQEARVSLKNHSKLLTVALPVWARYINQSYNDTATVKSITDAVDFASLMAYDYNVYSHPWRRFTGPNAPLFRWSYRTKDESQRHVKWSVEYWSQILKMPKEKIIVGVPFFGRIFNITHPEKNHSFLAEAQHLSPAYGWDGKVTFNRTCYQFLKEPKATLVYNKTSQTPYVYNEGKSTWVSYDNRRSICEKVNWIYSNGYGGVMSFAINFDDVYGHCRLGKFPLQTVIYDAIKNTPISSCCNCKIDCSKYDYNETAGSASPYTPCSDAYVYDAYVRQATLFH